MPGWLDHFRVTAACAACGVRAAAQPRAQPPGGGSTRRVCCLRRACRLSTRHAALYLAYLSQTRASTVACSRGPSCCRCLRGRRCSPRPAATWCRAPRAAAGRWWRSTRGAAAAGPRPLEGAAPSAAPRRRRRAAPRSAGCFPAAAAACRRAVTCATARLRSPLKAGTACADDN